MSDLRELIAGRIWHDDWVKNVGEEPPYPWDSEEYEDGMSTAVDAEYRDTADRIIELVREALLAPDVVRAGARAIVADPNFGRNTWTDDARNVLTAALAAVTEGTYQ